jgi:hypothetical protein
MIALAFAEGATWYNYPGLELWKFINLAIFTGVAIYILRKPISAALATRRDAIRQELVQAQQANQRGSCYTSRRDQAGAGPGSGAEGASCRKDG